MHACVVFTCVCKTVFVLCLMLKLTVNCEQQAIFLLLLSTLTFLNQLGETDSITVFNNGKKNEKFLKVAIPPYRLSEERKSTAMQFIVTELTALGLLL